MSKKKLLVLTLVLTFVGLSFAVGSRVFSYYRGYHHFAHGEFSTYLIDKWQERLDLTEAQVQEALDFYEAHRAEIDAFIQAEAALDPTDV